MNYHLAIDIGASSGRHMLGFLEDGKIVAKEIYRFKNEPKLVEGTLCWDIKNIFSHVLTGIKKCNELKKIPTTMSIDTWGVDFVLLDNQDEIIGNCVCYRDTRTKNIDKFVEEIISFEDLYTRTGIQKQDFNTIYQLMAIKKNNPDELNRAKAFLMIPDYLLFLLTGKKSNEYTNASTTSLVSLKSKNWDYKLIDKLGISSDIFSDVKAPGSFLSNFKNEVKAYVGFDCEVVLCPSHDTASAVLSLNNATEDSVYISSGTWSLLGVKLDEPITSEQARLNNFTNEGGYNYKYRFLKNIMGLWIIQAIKKELNDKYSFPDLIDLAKNGEGCSSIIDVNHDDFLYPKSMIGTIKNHCEKSNQQIPKNIEEVLHCVYISLAKSYADAILNLENIINKKITAINIIGGGSQDKYLNKLTSEATGLAVYTGEIEATVIGNLKAQMIYKKEIDF